MLLGPQKYSFRKSFGVSVNILKNSGKTAATINLPLSGFGGLEVAKFAGSNPAEAFIQKGSKADCPMSHISGM